VGAILDVLYPPKCLACNVQSVENVNLICPTCWKELEFMHHPLCSRCGVALPASYLGSLCMRCTECAPSFDAARSVLRYNEASKDMLHRFKFEDRTQYAKRFARMLYNAHRNFISQAEIMLAVPMHKVRLRERKYNHAALLANALSKLSGIPFDPAVLHKQRLTSLQATLGYAERQVNLEDAFSVCRSEVIRGRVVLLVDDIMTTGATVNECAHILKKAGAHKVIVTTLAHTY
jgi:ComF family protein